jgi:hypothetical protein
VNSKSSITLHQTPASELTAAKIAHLRYVNDHQSGISHHRARDAFKYLYPEGSLVDDPDELAAIRALAIPPAWESVWICPSRHGHIQATEGAMHGIENNIAIILGGAPFETQPSTIISCCLEKQYPQFAVMSNRIWRNPGYREKRCWLP